MKNESRCGYIAIVGRPNVGKSTLLNRILGEKISITSRKPQTTRHKILGIKTQDHVQAIYVDTPGIHKTLKRAINRRMNKAASSAIHDVDVIVFIVDARIWHEEDELVLNKIRDAKCPVILALNKVDLIKDKQRLLPILEARKEKMNFLSIIPISAARDINIDQLEKLIYKLLPQDVHFFPKDQITDRDDRFRIAEIVREKLIRATGQEVPFGSVVMVESMKLEKQILHIDVVIWVERRGQKNIIIGKKGEKLKNIGTLARLNLEKLFDCKVFLTLWVKVKEGWSDDERMLNRFEL